jgi:serine/threonine-protein kinase
MVSRPSPCDRNRLEQLLAGRLPDEEQADLSGHLERCESCRSALEGLAAGTRWWADVRRLSGPGGSDDGGGPTEGGPRAGEATECLGGDGALFGFLAPSDDPEHLGRVGPYEVGGVIGRGGMSVVLKAFDPALNRPVAVKVLAPELAASAAARRRFAREARAAAAVSHDHVVAIHAVDTANGLPYLVMPYLPGRSLQERLDRNGPLAVEEILRIGMQTAAGLAAAHAQGLVHRDVKPANILLENGVERVKITDFGLARAIDDASLSQSGVVAGTPQYMAPEQARGEAVDHRADLFSLSSVLYAMATGHSPFRAATTMAVLRRVSDEEPRPVREVNPEVPEWLAAIIAKLHEKDPADRFQSAAEVAELLGRCLAYLQQPTALSLPALPKKKSQPAPRRRFSRWAGAAAAIAAVFAGLGATESAGVTHIAKFVATVLRIRLSQGQEMVVETNDPEAKVKVDGDELSITGVGPQEIRVRAGDRFAPAAGGVGASNDLITIDRGEQRTTRIRMESARPPAEVSADARTAALRKAVARFEDELAAVKRELGAANEPAFARIQKQLESLKAELAKPPADGSRWMVESRLGAITTRLQDEITRTDANLTQATRVARDPKDPTILHYKKIRERLEGELKGLVDIDRRQPLTTGTAPPPHPPLTTGTAPPLPPSPPLADVVTTHVRSVVIPGPGESVLPWETRPVLAVAVSPDGSLLALACFDGTVKLWDLRGKRPRATLKARSPQVWSVAFSPDGEVLASAGGDWDRRDVPGQVSLWDVAEVRELADLPGHPALVLKVAFSPGGKALATACRDGTVRLWDVATRTERAALTGHTDAVRSVAFSPDGRILASGSFDSTVRLWDASSGKILATLCTKAVGVNDVAFSPDGKTLAATGRTTDPEAAPVTLWDVATRTERLAFGGSVTHPLCLAFSPDGQSLASGGGGERAETGELRLWNPATGRERASLHVPHSVECVTFTPDGKTMITGGWDGVVRLWDVEAILKPAPRSGR